MDEENYEISCLKKLKLQRLPRFQALSAGENPTNNHQPLFHEKINLPSLEELYLSNLCNIEDLWNFPPSDSASAIETFSKLHVLTLDKMPRLKHVWSKELREGSMSFGNLKKLYIVDCVLLEGLCPPTIPVVLSKLDSLEVIACDYLKEVVMTENKAENVIEFPSLKRLKLEKLSSLQCFCQGSYTIKFPSLKILSLSSLPKMLTFIKPKDSGTSCCSPTKGEVESAQEESKSFMKRTPLFGEIVFPSLENLELSEIEDIEELVDEKHAAIAFPELKGLTMSALHKLEFIPETILNNLEQLKVHNCDSLHGLFEVKSTPSILSLRDLELVDVGCLKCIPWSLLPNLHSLVIHGGLLDMKSIISSTTIVQGNVLHQLEYMNIEKCEHLEEIVSKECDDELELELLKNGTFMFTRLKHVKLHSLPKIATFSSGSYEAIFPSLEKVEISSCPSFVSFTLGTPEMPKLASFQLNQESILEQYRYNDLKNFTQPQNQGCSEMVKGTEQGEALLQPIKQRTVKKTRKALNEATEILPGGWLYEKSPIAINKELITSDASSNQSNGSIFV